MSFWNIPMVYTCFTHNYSGKYPCPACVSIPVVSPNFTSRIQHEMHLSKEMLRDWFAGQALAGILSDYNYEIDENLPLDKFEDKIASNAYKQADAMLKAREVKGE